MAGTKTRYQKRPERGDDHGADKNTSGQPMAGRVFLSSDHARTNPPRRHGCGNMDLKNCRCGEEWQRFIVGLRSGLGGGGAGASRFGSAPRSHETFEFFTIFCATQLLQEEGEISFGFCQFPALSL
jgi:hypothetical protein